MRNPDARATVVAPFADGSVTAHLFKMSLFAGIGLAAQSLYVLIDLFFVAKLGDRAVAAVASAGSLTYFALAGSQVISVGTVALMAHARGARDDVATSRILSQTVLLALVAMAVWLAGGYALIGPLSRLLAPPGRSVQLTFDYLSALLPSLALLFPNAALGSVLRAEGAMGRLISIQTASVLLNAILAPVLIVGLGTGVAFGVWGAGLATTIASGCATLGIVWLMLASPDHRRSLLPGQLDVKLLRRLLSIGIPSGLELMINFLATTFIYWSLKDLGPSAQGGYGIGARIIMSAAMPATAIAFGAVAVAGQNIGARSFERVRRIWIATQVGSLLITLPMILFIELYRHHIVASFTSDPRTASLATTYLAIMTLSLIPLAVSGASTSLLQAMGATRASMAISLSRAVVFCTIILLTVKLDLLSWGQAWVISVVSSALHAAYLSKIFTDHFNRIKSGGPVRVEGEPASSPVGFRGGSFLESRLDRAKKNEVG